VYYTPRSDLSSYLSPEATEEQGVNTYNAVKFLNDIKEYDVDSQVVTTGQVFREILDILPNQEPPEGHLHQAGARGTVLRGRFNGTAKSGDFLSKFHKLTALLVNVVQDPKEANGPQSSTGDDGAPEFFYRLQNYSMQAKEAMNKIMVIAKHDKLCRDILGLTKSDRSRWLKDWTPLEQREADKIGAGVNILLGDMLPLYYNMSIISLLVRFYSKSSRKPILLRLSIGIDPRKEIRDCNYCDYGFSTLDYLGPEGALRLHDSFSKRNLRKMFSTTYVSETNTLNLRWSETATMHLGWSRMPVVRACQHGKTTIYHDDVLGVHNEREEWDPTPSKDHTCFQPFPSDDRLRIIETGCSHVTRFAVGELKLEMIDVHIENAEEEFDPNAVDAVEFNAFPADKDLSFEEFCFQPADFQAS